MALGEDDPDAGTGFEAKKCWGYDGIAVVRGTERGGDKSADHF